MHGEILNPKIRVVVIDNYMPERIRVLFRTRLQDVANVSFHETTPNADDLAEASVIVAWQPQEEYYAKATKCVLFQALSAGLNSKRIKALQRVPAITLANLHSNAYPVAQHAVALLLAAANRLMIYHDRTRSGAWRGDSDNPPSLTLQGTRVGVLGLGAIGAAVIKFLSGFDVILSGCSRSGRSVPGLVPEQCYPSEQVLAFLHDLQVLMVCLPLTDETAGLVGEEQLQVLHPGAIVVNVSRGPIIKEQALYEALRSGHLGGAGIDVWYDYKQAAKGEKHYPYSLPFHELPNVVLSPHRAASPIYAEDRWDVVIENIKRAATGRRDFINVVDVERGY